MGYVGPPVLRKKTPCRSVTSSKALLGLCCLVLGQSCHVMRLPLTAQNSAIKRCPQCRRPCIIWQHVTFCLRYTFKWYQPQTESHRADAYQSPRNPHCTIISSDHTQAQALIYQSSTNSYWSDTKPRLNNPLYFLLMVLDLHAGKRLSSFSTILSVLFRVKEHHEQ